MTIGILAVQGDFRKHIEVLDNLGISRLEIRNGEALNSIDGLIIPGGESTTIHKLLVKGNFFAEAREFALRKPVFGTCAGAIMLSRELDTNNGLETLGAIDIRIRRNAYGRQVDSFIDEVEFMGERIEAVFIRAPKIINTGKNVEILAEHNGGPVLVREENVLACTFHPELTDNYKVHEYFLSMVEKSLISHSM